MYLYPPTHTCIPFERALYNHTCNQVITQPVNNDDNKATVPFLNIIIIIYKHVVKLN